MHALRRHLHLATLLILSAPHLLAQTPPDAQQAIRIAVASELQAAQTDKSIWMYRDEDDTPEKRALYNSVETRQGELRRMIEENGRPLDAAQTQAETQRIDEFIHDTSAQNKVHKSGAHDDEQATQLTKMLPDAFVWTYVSQTPEFLTLSFRPNPSFDPPNLEARIMGMMAGQLVIVRDGNRIRTLKGQLTETVSIGFGLIKMFKGGTFDIERRQVGGGHWQIAEVHNHISGHALFFKSISIQEDEVKTDWRPSTAETYEAAAHVLNAQR